jgi:hypothetical protein
LPLSALILRKISLSPIIIAAAMAIVALGAVTIPLFAGKLACRAEGGPIYASPVCKPIKKDNRFKRPEI